MTNTRDHIYDLRQLESFSHFDEYGKDQGINSKFRDVRKILHDQRNAHCISVLMYSGPYMQCTYIYFSAQKFFSVHKCSLSVHSIFSVQK